jgi:hypothetical protein
LARLSSEIGSIDLFGMEKGWSDIASHRTSHESLIVGLERELFRVETDRLAKVEAAARAAVARMQEVGFKVISEIEREIDPEVALVNVAVVRNRGAYVDLVGRLKVEQVEAEAGRRARWEAQLARWRVARNEALVLRFQREMQDREAVDPPGRARGLLEIDGVTSRHADALLGRLYALMEEAPPALVERRAGELRAGFEGEASSLRRDCAEAVAALADFHSRLHERHLAMYREVVRGVVECGMMSQEEAESSLAPSCLSLVEARREESLALEEAVTAALSAHAAKLDALVDGVLGYVATLASDWQAHEAASRSVCERAEAVRGERAREHREARAMAEEQLAQLLGAMRTAENEPTLDALLARTLAHLEDMERGFRAYARRSIELAEEEPRDLERAHHAYQLTVSRHTRLRHPEREAEDAERARLQALQEEEAHKALLQAQEDQQDKAKQKPAAGAAVKKDNNNAGVKETKESKERALAEAERVRAAAEAENRRLKPGSRMAETGVAVEDIDVVTTKAGTRYEVVEAWEEEIAAELEREHQARLKELEDKRKKEAEEDEKRAAAAGAEDGNSRPGSQPNAEGKKKPAAAAPAKLSKAQAEAEAAERARAEARRAEDEALARQARAAEEARAKLSFGMPVPPAIVLATIRSALRRAVVEHLDAFAASTLADARARAAELVTRYEEDLDAVLREHRPRPVAAEMDVHGPRRQELTQHRGSYERHVRVMEDKVAALEPAWKELLARFVTLRTQQDAAILRLASDMGELGSNISLEAHVRKARAHFQAAKAAVSAKMTALLAEEAEAAATLKRANTNLLSAWRTIVDGGTLATDELAAYRLAVERANERVEAVHARHTAEGGERVAEALALLDRNATNFEAESLLHLEDVAFLNHVANISSLYQSEAKVVFSESKVAEDGIEAQLAKIRDLFGVKLVKDKEEAAGQEVRATPRSAAEGDDDDEAAGGGGGEYAVSGEAKQVELLEALRQLLELRARVRARGFHLACFTEAAGDREDDEANPLSISVGADGRITLVGAEPIPETSGSGSGSGAGADPKAKAKADKDAAAAAAAAKKKKEERDKKAKADKEAAAKKLKAEAAGGKKASDKRGEQQLARPVIPTAQELERMTLAETVALLQDRCRFDLREMASRFYQDKAARPVRRPKRIPATEEAFAQINEAGVVAAIGGAGASHVAEAVRAFRAQVDDAARLVRACAPLLMTRLADGALDGLARSLGSLAEEDSREYGGLETQRERNVASLKAGLQTAKHHELLAALDASEQERQAVQARWAGTHHERVAAALALVAKTTTSQLADASVVVLQLIGVLVEPRHVVPDETVVPERKTVRALAKDNLRLQAGVVRPPTRDWAGLNAELFTPARIAAQVGPEQAARLFPELSSSEQQQSQQQAEESSSKGGKQQKPGKGQASKQPPGAAGDAQVGSTAGLTVRRGPTERAVMKARQTSFDRLVAEHLRQSVLLAELRATRRERAAQWQKTWAQIVREVAQGEPGPAKDTLVPLRDPPQSLQANQRKPAAASAKKK